MAQQQPKPVLTVPVLPGMRQDVSPHLAPVGTLTSARNVRFPVQGEAQARCGTAALSAATDCDVTYSQALSGSEVAFAKQCPGGFLVGCNGYGYRYSADAERLHASGSYANAEPLGVFDTMAREDVTISAGDATPYPLSQVAVGGYVATVYSCGNGAGNVGPGDGRCVLHVFTQDGVLVTSANLNNVSAAWLVADGSSASTFVLITQGDVTSSSTLAARICTTSASGVTIGAAVAVATLSASTNYWSACLHPGIGWLLAYQSGAALATVARLAGTTTADTGTQAMDDGHPLSVYSDGTNIFLGARTQPVPPTSSAVVYIFDAGLTIVTFTVLATEAAGAYLGPPMFGPSLVAGSVMYAITRSASPGIDGGSWVVCGELTAVGAATSATANIYQCTAASAPFGNGYIWVRAGSSLDTYDFRFERVMLLDFMGRRVTGADATAKTAAPVIALTGVAYTVAGTSGYEGGWYRQALSAPVQLADGSWLMGIPRLVRADAVPGGEVGGLSLAEWLHFAIGGPKYAAAFAETAIVSGFPTLARSNAGTRNYDGSNTLTIQRDGIDLGFPVWPGISAPVASASFGGLTPSSTYQWCAVLERIDSSGRRWRSAPSKIATETLGVGENTAALTARANVDWFRAGTANYRNDSRFVMHFYRTEANGETFYRCTPPQGAPTSSSTGEFTFTDLLDDAFLRTGEILYTDGGVLGNDAPPSCRFVACTEDRVWCGGLWEAEQIQSSKILVPGEPPQFSDSPAFRAVLPEPCTGLAVQDGVVFAFTASAIYGIAGGGPSDQGAGAWDSPRVITRETGCVNARAILETSAGIFFQSGRGIELLPRGGGQVQFLGAAVQDAFFSEGSGAGMVLSAAVITSRETRTARFLIGGSNALTFDLSTGAWAIDEYPAGLAAVCDSVSGGVLAFASPTAGGSGFLLEDLTALQDSVGDDPSEVISELAWAGVHPFTLAGWGRFNTAVVMLDELAAGYGDGDVTLTSRVDNAADVGATFPMSALSAPDYREHLQAQVDGSALRLTLQATAGGWRCMGWTIAVNDHGGSRRAAASERA